MATNLDAACRMRGVDTAALAARLGTSAASLTEYRMGRRELGNKLLPAVASALAVSPAYLRGIAERIPVYDWVYGTEAVCPIISSQEIDGYGVYYVVDHPEVGWMAVILSGGTQFTPRNWRGRQPLSVDEIDSVAWIDNTGREAMMADGLPRSIEPSTMPATGK